MIHVRVVSPPDLTERLLSGLAADPGVRNLLVLVGAGGLRLQRSIWRARALR
jgi:hypothetical protein